MKFLSIKILLICSALTLAACAPNDPNRRAKTGATLGAIAGAVLGHQLDDKSGRWAGAALGALIGGGAGYYMDEQQREFENALREEQEQNQLEIERLRDDTLKLTVDSEISFDFNKANIRPTFYQSLNKLANVINKYDRTVVHIVGHTDSKGANAYNQTLSERRANSVQSYLMTRGVQNYRLETWGRGESEPRATNTTEAGRQLNRRVEIFIKPVVQGQEERAYQAPTYTG